MKKLDQIEKKQIFTVPDGYFDQLPLAIQERVAQKRSISWFSIPVLRLALPVVALLVVGIVWFKPFSSSPSIEEELSMLNESDLIAYLNESDLTSEELENTFNLSSEEIDNLEQEVFQSLQSNEGLLENLIDEYTIETENF
jgi:hypothetical protein